MTGFSEINIRQQASKKQKESCVTKDQGADDIQLIESFKAGEEPAFDAIVERYQNLVYNVLYSFAVSRGDLEDIAQEVFIKVYQNIGSFSFRSSFRTWLYRVAMNTAIDFVRKRKARPVIAIEELGEDITALLKRPDSSAADRASDDRKLQLIRTLIDKLPDKYRNVVILRDIEGLSYQEIANVLKCSVGTVESRLFRARERLKELVSVTKM